MKRQVLIFDLDGTLIDSRRDLAAGINLMRRHYGLGPLPVETVAGYVGEGIRKLVTRSLADATFAVDLEEAVRLDTEFYRQHIHDETTLYPGVRKGLGQLARAGHVLALLTNKPAQACHMILRHFKIDALFACVIGGDSGVPLKPDPGAVHAILRAVGGAPAETWMIGDNHTDIAAAHRAGARSAFVSYGIGAPGTEPPTRTFASFPDLTRFFLDAGHAQN